MAAPPTPGTVLDGKYLLQDVIGHGRFGTVYRAVHVSLQKPVAVKVLHGGLRLAADDFLRFRTEAEALGRLSHPHVVAISDFGVDPVDGGLPYLVMALIDGRSLHELTGDGRPVDLATTAAWVRQVADALEHAHERGVAHGDLTARNVLVTDAGGAPYVTVVDFGLAHLVEPDTADAGTPDDVTSLLDTRWTATLEYCAPERLRGWPPTPEGDVYSLAVLAYRLLTGAFPFAGTPQSIAMAQLTATAPAASSHRPSLPSSVDETLAAGLAKDPRDRADVQAVSASLSASARAVARAEWRRRERPRRSALALVVAVVTALAGWWLAPAAVLQRLDGATEDARFALQPPRAPDHRLLLVAIDETTLAADATPLSLRGDEFARGLRRAFASGVEAMAIDLLLPEPWARAPAFGDLLLHHADRLVLAMVSDGRSVIGPEAVDPLVAEVLGAERASRLFALASNVPAADGVVRRGRAAVVDTSDTPRATLAGRLATLAGARPPPAVFPVDYTTDATALPRTTWQDFVGALDAGARFDGRLVLLGAEYAGSGDRHRVPQPRRWPVEVSGLTLQGLLASSLLQGPRLVEGSAGWAWTGVASATAAGVMGVLWLPRRALPPWLAAWLTAGVVVAALGIGVGVIVPLAAPLLSWVVAMVTGAVLRTSLPARPE